MCMHVYVYVGDGRPACVDGDFIELWAVEFKGRIESARAELTRIEMLNDCEPSKLVRMQLLISNLDNMKTDTESDQLLDGKTTKTTKALQEKKASVIPDFSLLYLSALHTSLELSYDTGASAQTACDSRLEKLVNVAGFYSTIRTEEAMENLQGEFVCSGCTLTDRRKLCKSCAGAANISDIASKLGEKKFCAHMQDKGTEEYQRFSIHQFIQDLQDRNPVCREFGIEDAIVDEYATEIKALKDTFDRQFGQMTAQGDLTSQAAAACDGESPNRIVRMVEGKATFHVLLHFI